MLGDFESEVIFEVAEALRAPVLILTIVALAVVVAELGAFLVEVSRRRRRDLDRLRDVAEQHPRAPACRAALGGVED